MNLLDENSVIKKHFTIPNLTNMDHTIEMPSKSTVINTPLTIFFDWGSGYERTGEPFSDSLVSGSLTGTTTGGTFEYGEQTFSSGEIFSFRYNNTAHRSSYFWTDNGINYTLRYFENTSGAQASFACDNTDLGTVSPFSFSVVKDFGSNYCNSIKSLNNMIDGYVLQPIAVYGKMSPIYTISGGNGAVIPVFTEINVDGIKFFVIGSNFCIKE